MARGCFSPSTAKFLAGRGGDFLSPLHSPARTPALRDGDPTSAGSPLQPWRLPARGLAVFHGEADTARLSHYFLPRLLLRDRRVLFLDGANSADPRLLERLARQRGADFHQLCRNLQIARAFTCFQLSELITRVPQFRREFPAEVVLVTAFPELYYDEDIRDADARISFERALRDLTRWAGCVAAAHAPVAVAVFSTASQAGALPAPARRHFFPRLLAAATEVWRFREQQDGRLELNCERVVAEPGQRGLLPRA